MKEGSDKTVPHFNINAAVVRQLGEELISDEVTALMELVKNSYDADASMVDIEISLDEDYNKVNGFYDRTGGYILVEDDGTGMRKDDIINRWLTISFSSKREMKRSGILTDKDRTPLGDKGLGRLSTQRLGSVLEMFTEVKGEKVLHSVGFDWSDFTEDVSLGNVEVKYKENKKPENRHGTRLLITSLKNPSIWKGDSAIRVVGQLSQLIFPYENDRPFNIFLKINGEKYDLDSIGEKIRRLSSAQYDIKFNEEKLSVKGVIKFLKLRRQSKNSLSELEKTVLFDKGEKFFSYLTNKEENKKNHISPEIISKSNDGEVFIEIDQIIDISSIGGLKKDGDNIANPGNFRCEIDDYDFRSNSQVEAQFDNFSDYKKVVQNQIGVRVFRDGFGVKPYGFEGQDWLRLGQNQTSSKSFYGLRPGNIVGYVEISASGNSNLKEKTDREGFVENAYYNNFYSLLKKGLDSVEIILEKTRRSYNEYFKENSRKEAGISNITEGTKAIKKASSLAKRIRKKAKELKADFDSLASEVESIENEAVQNGKSQKKGTEKINKLFKLIKAALIKSDDLLSSINKTVSDTEKLEQVADYIEPTVRNLELQLLELSELASLGLTTEALSHEIANVTSRLLAQSESIKKYVRKSKISDSRIISFIEESRQIGSSLRKQVSHLAPSLRYVREKRERINMKQFINDQENFYRNRFANKNISIKTIATGDNFSIHFNRGKLTQIFDNLILNSEYWLLNWMNDKSGYKGEITIKYDQPYVLLYDNGFGIDESISSMIFQPFITLKPDSKGRGLGLFIVDQFLEAEGANIFLRGDKNKHGNKYIFQIDFSNVIK